jgi:hypothetical protein
MRKLLTVAAAVLATAMFAGPVFAAVQNVRVSGSVDSTYLYRKNFDFGENSSADELQSTFLTQSILQVDADLTDQVGATIALINERSWEQDDDSDSGVDILLAYVKLREMLYSPLTLIIGRQSFAYGNSFIIDSAGTNNSSPAASGINSVADDLTKQTTLDAIRAILDYNPLTIDIVYAQFVETNGGSIYENDNDTFLTGVNANYQLGDEMGSVIEAYFWKKIDKVGNAGGKADNIYTVGGRVSTNLTEALNIQLENAYQKGTHGGFGSNYAKRDAWALQFITNYQLPLFDEYNPTAQYVFTKVTGNAEDSDDDGDFTGWDPMLENQAGGKIYNSLFNLTNSEIHTMTFGFNPMEDVLAKLSVTGLWLERRVGEGISSMTLQQPGSSTETVSIKRENTWLGKEVDLELVYDYTEDVQIGGNFGWFIPGSFFTPENDQSAKQAIVHMNVAF